MQLSYIIIPPDRWGVPRKENINSLVFMVRKKRAKLAVLQILTMYVKFKCKNHPRS